MKNLDAGDWGLLECEEKKYDAKQTASFSDDLVRDFQDYHDRAKELEAGYGRYYNNATHVGKAAEASKEFIGRRQTDEIHFENLDIQREFLNRVCYIEDAFKDMVDPSPNAKIDSVVLKEIKQEQQVFSRVFDEEGYELERWTKMMVEEFGKFGVSTLPSCSLIRNIYEELSGPGGHLDKCNKKLKEFDDYCLNYLNQSGLKERVYNLQCTIKNTACGLDGLTVYTPCMAKNPIDVIKKITNFFKSNKTEQEPETKHPDEVNELLKEKFDMKKKEAEEKRQKQREIHEQTVELLNAYGEITQEDYNYLLAISGEATTYEGFVAVAYSVINRAVKRNQTIVEVVSAERQYAAFNQKSIGVVSNTDVDDAIRDIMNGKVDNPIGDCDYYFGRAPGKHNIWVEDFDECGKIILVEGNVFYTEDDVGKIHNSKDIDAQYDDSSKIIYNAEDGSGWINGSKNGVIKDN